MNTLKTLDFQAHAKTLTLIPDNHSARTLRVVTAYIRALLILALSIGCVLMAPTAHAQFDYLYASDPGNNDQFGSSVGISGDFVIAGSPNDDNTKGTDAGAVYFFRKNGSSWDQMHKRLANDGAANDKFGMAVAIDGDYAVVGAYAKKTSGVPKGAAYVFKRTSTGWSQVKKLTANDAGNGDFFGWSVAISGTTIAIGAPYEDNAKGENAGAVYVYGLTSNGWTQQKKLVANDGAASDQFGFSVGISGNTIVAGAPVKNTVQGAIYIFNKGSNGWSQVAKRTANDGRSFDRFGNAVAIDGGIIAVGAPYDVNNNDSDAGSVYLFFKSPNGWNFEQKVLSTGLDQYHRFGSSVAVDDNYVVASAPGISPKARFYVFKRISIMGSPIWTQEFGVESPYEGQDGFARSVDVSGAYLLSGAPGVGSDDRGSAYVLAIPGYVAPSASVNATETVAQTIETTEKREEPLNELSELPDRLTLHGNYPNPFNPATTIRFDLPQAADVTLEVVNLMGQLVLRSEHRGLSAGANQQIQLDGSNLASGTYLYRLTAVIQGKASMVTGRMTLIK